MAFVRGLVVLPQLGDDVHRRRHRGGALRASTFGKLFGWQELDDFPQWVFALIALVIVLALNLISVKLFGEMEFWFALIKVSALVIFLIVGVLFIVFGGHATDIGPVRLLGHRRQRWAVPGRGLSHR